MVLGPLLFLVILEAGLRLAGVGHPMSFFLQMRVNGKDSLIENDRFGWRFFGPEMARTSRNPPRESPRCAVIKSIRRVQFIGLAGG